MPTAHWKSYTRDNALPDGDDVSIRDYALEYIERWAQMIVAVLQSPVLMSFYGKYTLADFIIGIHNHLLERELDDTTKGRLYEVFAVKNN